MLDLTVGKEWKVILKFAMPIMLGMFFQHLYSIVDSMLVGKFLPNGELALAAIGAAFPVIFVMISLVIGISNGATILISHYFGAKDFAGVQKTVDTINIFLLGCAIVISLVGYFLAESIFTFIDLPVNILPYAVDYLQIYSLGFVLMFGFHGISAILRGLGDSKKPLYFLIIASVLHVFLDWFFIVVLGFGIKGVAWATIISQGLTFVGVVWYINTKYDLLQIRIRKIFFDAKIFKKSISLGLPSGLQQAFVGLGNVALFSLVSDYSSEVIAGYSVVSRIEMFCFVPVMALSMSFTVFVGQNIGANKIERAVKGFWQTMYNAFFISIVLALLLIVFRNQVISLFTYDSNVISVGADYLFLVMPFMIFFAGLFISNAALRGAGDTLIPMFVTLFALWVIRVPVSYYFSKIYGEVGIWWGIPAGWIIGMIFSTAYYITGNWKKKSLLYSIK